MLPESVHRPLRIALFSGNEFPRYFKEVIFQNIFFFFFLQASQKKTSEKFHKNAIS